MWHSHSAIEHLEDGIQPFNLNESESWIKSEFVPKAFGTSLCLICLKTILNICERKIDRAARKVVIFLK